MSSPQALARYTRIVGWNLRTISVAMLMVLFVLPLSGTLCALACDQAAHSEGSGHHHEATPESSQPAAPDAPLVGGPSAHPCDHLAVIQQAIAAPERTQIAVSVPAAMVTVGNSRRRSFRGPEPHTALHPVALLRHRSRSSCASDPNFIGRKAFVCPRARLSCRAPASSHVFGLEGICR